MVLRSGRSFAWTSFQLHKNVKSQSYVDEGVRTSLLLAWSECSWSEFVRDRDVSVKDSAIFFELFRTHCAKGHRGNRYSLVAYMHPKLHLLTGTTNNRLGDPSDLLVCFRNAGFRHGLAELPARIPPKRVRVSPEMKDSEDVVYIGRGHAGLGLTRSPWADPYAISRTKDRTKVVKDFKRNSEGSTVLQ